jgi:protein-disulfide isomerase
MANDRRSLARLGAATLAAVGLAVSSALLVDSLQPVPMFCAADGCAAVRETAWARPLGVPLPAFGMLFFALWLALVVAGPRAAAARKAVALAGGAGGLGFLAIQGFVIGEWCRLCVVVDVVALAGAALAIATWSQEWPRAGGRAIAAALAIALVGTGLPFARLLPAGGEALVAVSPSPPAGLPAAATGEQAHRAVTIVEYVDFECQHCRALHARLMDALARTGTQVRVVRKMVPLPNHRGAMPAAIAWCCADAQGRGDEMAEALLAAPVAQLTPEGCERLAADLGLDLARYRADAAAPAIARRIAADMAEARADGIRALPTVYIGREVFVGAAASVDDLVAALRRASAS